MPNSAVSFLYGPATEGIALPLCRVATVLFRLPRMEPVTLAGEALFMELNVALAAIGPHTRYEPTLLRLLESVASDRRRYCMMTIDGPRIRNVYIRSVTPGSAGDGG